MPHPEVRNLVFPKEMVCVGLRLSSYFIIATPHAHQSLCQQKRPLPTRQDEVCPSEQTAVSCDLPNNLTQVE